MYPHFTLHSGGRLYLVTILICCSLTAHAQKTFTANGRTVNTDSLKALIGSMMTEVGVPGLSLAIISDNKIVFSESYGYKRSTNAEKVNDRTVFEACSLSKSFLVFVVYKLIDAGKLELDKPMYQYLEYAPLAHDPRYKLITPRMILSHCSGIENMQYLNDPNKLEILSNPGEKFVYSGEGYQYLSKVVELILQQPYEEYIRKMVFKPLKLKRSYTVYKRKGKSPSNYATGHNKFGKELDKWKNLEPRPAGGVHTTAEDYANLIISLFNDKHLTRARRNDILKPVVRIEKINPFLFYGPGFEIVQGKTDTLVSHGGLNPGFRGLMFYSIARKSGFVMMSNSDRGNLMARKICESTVGLDIGPKYAYEFREAQYPSQAISLLKIYNDKGVDTMFSQIEEWKSKGQIANNTLSELGKLFMGQDETASKKLLQENVALFPQNAMAYGLLGDYYLKINDYAGAHQNLSKARELKFDLWEIDSDIQKCEAELLLRAKICEQTITLNANGSLTLEAENYCTMRGIETSVIADAEGGQAIGWVETDDWVSYNINVNAAGLYAVTFRIAGSPGGSHFQLRSGNAVVSTIDMEPSGWQTWTTMTKQIELPAGNQQLRVYATSGGFSLNWLQFAYGSKEN